MAAEPSPLLPNPSRRVRYDVTMRVSETPERTLRGIAGAVLLIPGLAFWCLIALWRAARSAPIERVHESYLRFSQLSMWLGGTRLEVHGASQLQPGQAYVVVANHESNWDPMCLLAGLPQLKLRFVIKQQLMRIPVFGAAMRATGNVSVVRHSTGRDIRHIRRNMEARDPEASVIFFAEGTRSRDGALHPFKLGAFATAIQEQISVLPVALAGTYRIWPSGTFGIRSGPAVIEVGEPIPIDGLSPQSRSALRDQTHELVRKLRSRARQRLRAQGCDPGGLD